MTRVHMLASAALLCAVAISSASSTSNVTKQDEGSLNPPVATTLDLPVYSKYVWRGINLVDDFVLQPSITFASGPLSLNVWSNWDLTDVNDLEGKVNEVDITGTYSGTLGGVAYSLGFVNYEFPNTGFDQTIELYGSATFPAMFSPTLAVYYDVDEAHGVYAKLSGSYTLNNVFMVGENAASLTLGLGIGYGDKEHNAFYYGNDESALADLGLSATLNAPINARTKAYLNLQYTTLLDKNQLEGFDKRSNFFGGIGVSYSF